MYNYTLVLIKQLNYSTYTLSVKGYKFILMEGPDKRWLHEY